MKLWLPARRDVASFAGVFGLLGAVYLLPPDTALRDVRAAGILRACLPQFYPPLVSGNAAAPGIDVELLQRVAAEIGIRLEVVTNADMGSDFNPRAWRLTRAQCSVIAGGVADSRTTRSFLDVTPPHASTGWAWVAARRTEDLHGQEVCVLVSATGLDRLALSTWLRAAKARVTIEADPKDLVNDVEQGRCVAGITERLLALQLAAQSGLSVGWMPKDLVRYPLVFGLWKGDLTLKRAIVAAMNRLMLSGELANIEARYIPAASIDQNEVDE
jgi:polar amino acid transport system substrate-binding protein/cystine transport system substrate-binding protein/membrane-bound lytic murein transglycosylase F